MEHKTSNYLKYAIGEIVLVVIGILIALQINNWNESRKDRITEQKILNILASEFNYNQQELERNIQKATRLKQRTDSILAIISNPNRVSYIEQFSTLTKGLSSYSTFDPSGGGLDNILNSGELNLMQDDSLKMKLSKWYGEVQDVKEDELRVMDFGDTYIMPLRIKFISFASNSRHQRDTEALMDNPDFENILYRFSSGVDYLIENYKILKVEIQSITKMINIQIKHD